jgi:hypothetical protein
MTEQIENMSRHRQSIDARPRITESFDILKESAAHIRAHLRLGVTTL